MLFAVAFIGEFVNVCSNSSKHCIAIRCGGTGGKHAVSSSAIRG